MIQGIEDINQNTKNLLSYILNARTFASQVEMEISFLFHCAYNYFSVLEEYTRSRAELYFLTQEKLAGKYNFDRCDHDGQLEEIIGCVKNTRPYMFIPPGGRMFRPS